MVSKPRRTKSLASFQHSSNKTSDWDDSDDDNKKEETNPSTAEPIITLPNGFALRPVRRTDTNAIHETLDDPTISMCYPDTIYPQPFNLWKVHKLIDETMDRKKSWRRRNATSHAAAKPAEDVYGAAVQALAGMNLEDRLAKTEHDSNDSSDASKRAKEQHRLIPVYYAIVHEDVFIGLIDLTFEDPLTPDDDLDDPADPAFLHEAEICYWISAKYRNRGIMTSVLREFLSWSWRNFAHLERIGGAVYSTWNPASCKVLRNCGFAQEGLWIGGVRKNGDFGNLAQFVVFRPGGKVELLTSCQDWER